MPTVASKDGTILTYTITGSGPGLIIVHGTFSDTSSHTELAQDLSSKFSVIIYGRRTLTLSAADPKANPPDSYDLQTEVSDLGALLEATKASYIFGISSGGVIALQTALKRPELVKKCAVWEPPIILKDSLDTKFVDRYNQEIHDGRSDAALVTAMLGSQIGPSIFQLFPRGILKWLTRKEIQAQERSKKEGEATLKDLAPTIGYDFKVIEGVKGDVQRFEGIVCEVLVIGSTASPRYIKTAVNALDKVLGKRKRVNVKGLGHGE